MRNLLLGMMLVILLSQFSNALFFDRNVIETNTYVVSGNYCKQNGVCQLASLLVNNLSVVGDVFNVSVVNYNVTGTIYADNFSGTFYGNGSNLDGVVKYTNNEQDIDDQNLNVTANMINISNICFLDDGCITNWDEVNTTISTYTQEIIYGSDLSLDDGNVNRTYTFSFVPHTIYIDGEHWLNTTDYSQNGASIKFLLEVWNQSDIIVVGDT